jgi:hypothetical protein
MEVFHMGRNSPQIERKPDRLIPLPASAVLPLARMRDEVFKLQQAHRLWFSLAPTTSSSVLTDGRVED